MDLADRIIDITLRFEGGVSNCSEDKGGFTICGISEVANPGWRGFVLYREGKDLNSLKPLIVDFYMEHYYFPLKLHLINDFSKNVVMFDFGVHSGVGRCIRKSQHVLNLKVDGIIGDKTMGAIMDSSDFAFKLLEARKEFLIDISSGGNKTFLKGWLNRVDMIKNLIS